MVLLHPGKHGEGFGHLEIFKGEIHIFIQVFCIGIELGKQAAIHVAILQDHGLTAHRRSGIFIGHLNVKINILAGVLVTLQQVTEDGSIEVEGCGTRTLPASGFVALTGLAKMGTSVLFFSKWASRLIACMKL